MQFDNAVSTRLQGVLNHFAPLAGILGGAVEGNLNEARTAYLSYLAGEFIPLADVTIAQAADTPCPTLLVGAQALTPERTILYIHGGGYVSGGPAMYRRLAGQLATATGAQVVVPDYRLAPEHPFPAPIDDVLATYRWLLDQGRDPNTIVFAGDSAGGAMVVSVMVKARNAGLPLPLGGVAFSPWANLMHDGETMYTREDSNPGFRAALDTLARRFLDGAPRNDPDASPVFADVRSLPPILIQVGEDESMMSDAVRLASHLSHNRVRTTLEVWPDMFHVWHLFDDILPDAVKALRNATIFIETLFEAVPPSRARTGIDGHRLIASQATRRGSTAMQLGDDRDAAHGEHGTHGRPDHRNETARVS